MRIVHEEDRGIWAWCGDAWFNMFPWAYDIELFCLLTATVI